MSTIRMCSSSHVRSNLPRKYWEERLEDSPQHPVVVLPGSVLWGRDTGASKDSADGKLCHSVHKPMVAPSPR